MLKAYKVRTYISVNDKPKIELGRLGHGLADIELPNVVTIIYSFQDCFDKELPIKAIGTGVTFFRKKPYVEIEYAWDTVDRYYDFDSITIEKHYEPYDVSLNELFEEYSADECIQYLKERGMTTCPILK